MFRSYCPIHNGPEFGPILAEVSVTHKQRWERWQAICQRITSHPNYKYAAPNVGTLLKLVYFAQTEMADANMKHWRQQARG